MTRETRLLLGTIVISGIVVLGLSTLRFPEQPAVVQAPPTPLERLAASATYEQLARSVERVARRVTPDLLVVRVRQPAAIEPRRLSDLLRGATPNESKYYPALRLAEGRALLATAAREELGVAGADGATRPEVLAIDPLRQVTVLGIEGAPSSGIVSSTLNDLVTPTYVVVAEGTAAGVTFRPVFVGSADRFIDPRWSGPLLAVSGISLTTPGALVFSLDGQFLGAALLHDNSLAIAAATDLIATAEEMIDGERASLTDIGIGVQNLTPALAEALKAPAGVVVAEVASDGPSAHLLAPLDVITAINGTPVTTADQLLLELAQLQLPVQLTVSRQGALTPVSIDGARPSRPESGDATAGVTLEYQRNEGSLVRALDPKHPAARAGIRVGDLIVRANGVAAPTPTQLADLLTVPDQPPALLLVVRRDGRDRVVAIAPGAVSHQ